MNAPTYKLAKHLIVILHRHLHLNYQYSVSNSTALAKYLTKLKINENHKIITYDIKDLYVKIPIQETLRIAKAMLLKENNTQTTKQIITLLETVLKQNYFSFQNNIYQPEKVVSVGSPISGTIAEIFLQHIENIHIKHLMDTKNIVYYTRYVDDILLKYDTKYTNADIIHEYRNNIHTNLQLNPTHKNNGHISSQSFNNQKPF